MIDHKQFREYIIRPSLQIISAWSPEAEEIIIATLAYESRGLEYLAEMGGDGVGAYMAHPDTYKETISFINRNMDIRNRIYKTFGYCLPPPISEARYNLRFATLACYCQYLMAFKKNPGAVLPHPDNLNELWETYKTYYNKSGDVAYDEFVKRYQTFIGVDSHGQGNEERIEGKRKSNGKKERNEEGT